jgi:hypothetical protein
MNLVLESIETGVAASPQVLRHSRRMVARNFSGATFTSALRHKDAAYAVALAESLLRDKPLVGSAAVQAYERAKAHAPDDDEGKMIEIVSRPKGAAIKRGALSARAQPHAGAQEFLRINRFAVDPGLIMQMRASRSAG